MTVEFTCPKCGGSAVASECLESCGVFTGRAECKNCFEKAFWQDGHGCWQFGHQHPYENGDKDFLEAARAAIWEKGGYYWMDEVGV
jgi:hypothetical protein